MQSMGPFFGQAPVGFRVMIVRDPMTMMMLILGLNVHAPNLQHDRT